MQRLSSPSGRCKHSRKPATLLTRNLMNRILLWGSLQVDRAVRGASEAVTAQHAEPSSVPQRRRAQLPASSPGTSVMPGFYQVAQLHEGWDPEQTSCKQRGPSRMDALGALASLSFPGLQTTTLWASRLENPRLPCAAHSTTKTSDPNCLSHTESAGDPKYIFSKHRLLLWAG